MRLGLDVAFELPEKHVIRIGLALLQRLVAVIGISAADDQFRGEFFHSLRKRLGVTDHMQPVRLHPAGDTAVTGNERCGTRRLHEGYDQFGAFLESGVIQTVLRNDDRSDIASPQRGFHICRLLLRIARLRDDQDKAATVFNNAHRFVHFRQTTLPTRSALVFI